MCGVASTKSRSFCSLSISPDIDECSLDPSPCDENADCTNSDGSYSCTCKQGFTGDGAVCQGTASFLGKSTESLKGGGTGGREGYGRREREGQEGGDLRGREAGEKCETLIILIQQ